MRTLWMMLVVAGRLDAAPMVYDPAPADNPLKGFVPYAGDWGEDAFPHSMEFRYFALGDLMSGEASFTWDPLDRTLEAVAARGHQLVLRVYLEYPGKESGLPGFLRDAGIGITSWEDGGKSIATPDYEDPRLRKALGNFVAALGSRYDDDPRLGTITAGLLGLWGEWHTYPKPELFASAEVQEEVMAAYENAFASVPVLLRYPRGAGIPDTARNDDRPFGYHDDSFAWSTLDDGSPGSEWHYLTALKAAGPKAVDKWKTRPVGGEVRPELWATLFTGNPHPKEQEFAECVRQTHVSWLMESGLFENPPGSGSARLRRATEAARRMGYEFHVSSASITATGEATIVVENRGVAPFYADWPVMIGNAVYEVETGWSLKGLMPGETRTWRGTFALGSGPQALRVPNPMPGGKPLRFANREQLGSSLVVLPE